MPYTNGDARFDAEQQGRCGLCGRDSHECKHCRECGGQGDRHRDKCPNGEPTDFQFDSFPKESIEPVDPNYEDEE